VHIENSAPICWLVKHYLSLHHLTWAHMYYTHRVDTLSDKLLRIRWSTISVGDTRSPLKQFLAGVILVKYDLNEAKTVWLLMGRSNCLLKLLLCSHLHNQEKWHLLMRTHGNLLLIFNNFKVSFNCECNLV
jgi:hypothetical protein